MALELTEEQKKAGWQVMRLGDVATITMGQSPQGSNVSGQEIGLPLLNGPTEFTAYNPVPVKWTEQITKIAEANDVLFCVRGSTTGRMNIADQRYVIGRGLASIRGVNLADTRFLYFMIQLYLPTLLQGATGSTFPNISGAQLQAFEIVWPPEPERNRIAEILGSVDDKIEANSRLLDSLYQLLHELYSYQISKSSNMVLLTNIADFVNGKAFTKDATGTGRMVVRIAELNNGPGASTVYNDVDNVDEKHLVNAGELLMSWSGSLGVFLWSREEAIVNQHIFKVIPKPGYSCAVVYCALESVIEDFQAIAKDKATTMGHIKRGDLETEVKIPSSTSEIEAVFSQISVLERENIALAETRDLLIRKLIK